MKAIILAGGAGTRLHPLTPPERAAAPTLYRVLTQSARRIAAGEHIALVLDEATCEIEGAGFMLSPLRVHRLPFRTKMRRVGTSP